MSVMDVAVGETAVGCPAYTGYVNPQWARPLQLLDMDADYVECRGELLRTSDGRTILDFLSGYSVVNAGHNHPAIVDALHQELDRRAPSKLQNHVSASAGEFAEQKICGNDFLVLKAAPPLNASAESIERFVSAIDQVLALVHSSTRFWQDALALAARAALI